MTIQAVFVDRDGTIGGTGRFIHPRNFAPFPGSIESVQRLQRDGIRVFAFTNQHRISRGEATVMDFESEFQEMGLDGWYICPHPIGGGCACQKPSPGLLHQAADEHGLDLTNCAVIGDVGSDMLAAAAVGAAKVLVMTGWGPSSLGEYRHKWADVDPDHIAQDFPAAVEWLLNRADNGWNTWI